MDIKTTCTRVNGGPDSKQRKAEPAKKSSKQCLAGETERKRGPEEKSKSSKGEDWHSLRNRLKGKTKELKQEEASRRRRNREVRFNLAMKKVTKQLSGMKTTSCMRINRRIRRRKLTRGNRLKPRARKRLDQARAQMKIFTRDRKGEKITLRALNQEKRNEDPREEAQGEELEEKKRTY